MTPSNFLSQLQNLIVGGTGFIKYQPLSIFDVRTDDGEAIGDIGEGDFGYKAVETNGLALAWNATDVTTVALNLMVPLDYDSDIAADQLKLAILAQMSGGDDEPAITAEAFRKRAGEALSADLAPASSAAVTDAARWVFVDLSGNNLQGGDVIHLELTPAAHGDDDLHVYGLAMVYKSCLVPFEIDDRK